MRPSAGLCRHPCTGELGLNATVCTLAVDASSIASGRSHVNARAHTSHTAHKGVDGELWHNCECSAAFAPLRMSAACCDAAACTGNVMPFAHPLVSMLRTYTPHAASVHHISTQGRGKDFAQANIHMQLQHLQGAKSGLKRLPIVCLQGERDPPVASQPAAAALLHNPNRRHRHRRLWGEQVPGCPRLRCFAAAASHLLSPHPRSVPEGPTRPACKGPVGGSANVGEQPGVHRRQGEC